MAILKGIPGYPN